MAGSSFVKFINWFLAILAISYDLSLFISDQNRMMMMMMPMVAVAAEDCSTDLRGLEIECMYYMNKGVTPLLDPNDRCCKVIKSANIPCCCRSVTQKITYPPGYTIEDMLNWTKVLHCFKFCGRPLAPRNKCGHFTVPPGPPPK